MEKMSSGWPRPTQPGGDLRRLAQQVGTGARRVVVLAATGKRRDQSGVAIAHTLHDLLPRRRPRQIDGHDVGAPAGQPTQRSGLAAGAQQHHVSVRQIEPVRMRSRQMQRLRVRLLDDAGGTPGIDAPRQAVAVQLAPLVRHLPAPWCRVALARQAQLCAAPDRQAPPWPRAKAGWSVAQERQRRPGGVESSLTGCHGGLRLRACNSTRRRMCVG